MRRSIMLGGRGLCGSFSSRISADLRNLLASKASRSRLLLRILLTMKPAMTAMRMRPPRTPATIPMMVPVDWVAAVGAFLSDDAEEVAGGCVEVVLVTVTSGRSAGVLVVALVGVVEVVVEEVTGGITGVVLVVVLVLSGRVVLVVAVVAVGFVTTGVVVVAVGFVTTGLVAVSFGSGTVVITVAVIVAVVPGRLMTVVMTVVVVLACLFAWWRLKAFPASSFWCMAGVVLVYNYIWFQPVEFLSCSWSNGVRRGDLGVQKDK